MKDQTRIELENIVYYKDQTHYFVMCAKKTESHPQRSTAIGAFAYLCFAEETYNYRFMYVCRDSDDISFLLSDENIDQTRLLAYAREAADFATEGDQCSVSWSF